MKKHIIIGMMMVASLFSSCSLDTAPTNRVSDDQALSSITNINLSMRGLYKYTINEYWEAWDQTRGTIALNMIYDIAGGTMVRDFTAPYKSTYDFTFAVSGAKNEMVNESMWMIPYGAFRRLNKMLEVVVDIECSEADEDLKNKLVAEMYSMRAFYNHSLNVTFSTHYDPSTAKTTPSVPLRLTSQKDDIPRSTQFEVNKLVLEDIEKALALFAQVKAPTSSTKYYTTLVVKMLKARVLLYNKDYTGALAAAEDIITNPEGKVIMGAANYKKGFNDSTNPEWIFSANYIADDCDWQVSTFAYLTQKGRANWWIKPMYMDLSYLHGINGDADLLKDANGLVVEKPYQGGLPNTVGLTMRADTDVRAELIIHDTKEEIAANLSADPDFYTDKGYANNVDWIIPGMINKFVQPILGAEQAIGDLCYMRLAEAYYIAAEAAAYLNNDVKARGHLLSTISPYDTAPGLAEHLNKSGNDLKTLIANYKAVDMWGEGRRLEDVKRRGEWVYRIGKYSYNASLGHTRQYKSVSPYIPSGAVVQFPDMLTRPIPQSELDSNSMISQDGNK